MENFTAKNYIIALIENQTNKKEWEETYPDGLSLQDIDNNDTVDVFILDSEGERIHHTSQIPAEIIDCGEAFILLDPENYRMKFKI